MRYQIGITIYNTFEVEADSKEEAQNKVRDYCNDAILNDCDFISLRLLNTYSHMLSAFESK